MQNGRMPRADRVGGSTTGMSLVERMVSPATLEPALDPMYGIPSRTRRRRGTSRSSSYIFFKSRNVLPPPTNTASASSTARTGSGAS